MRVFTVLGILFYASVLILIGIVMIILALNLLSPQDINNLLSYIEFNINSRIIVGLSGVLLILISFSFAQLILGRFQREKTKSFTTSSGEVTIALSAIEDLIRRLAGIMPEIKELRPDVIATKKGMVVDLRVVLRSETNIPELTNRLQDMVKSKIQEVVGLEEQIIVNSHIAKIATIEDKDKKKKEHEKTELNMPFSGYGRV